MTEADHASATDATASSSRLAEAHALDARAREIAHRNRCGEIEAAKVLEEMDSTGYWRDLTYSTLEAYAHEVYGYSPTKTRDLLRIVRAGAPDLVAKFAAGDVEWTKAREIAKVPPAEQAKLVADAPGMSCNQVRLKVGEILKRPVRIMFTRGVTAEERTELEQLETYLVEHGFETFGEGLAELSRMVRAGKLEGFAPAATVAVYDHCASCKRTTVESLEGPEPVTPAALEQALCNAEVLDLRSDEVKFASAIPARVVKVVKVRDKSRCQVPRCGRRAWVHLHHEGGRSKTGHDPDTIVPLCHAHHRQRHAGMLGIEIARPVVRFTRRDGSRIGEVRTGESPMEAIAHPPSPPSSSSDAA